MNTFEPNQPPDSSVEALNAYFARQQGQPTDDPLTNPAMFVRNTPPRRQRSVSKEKLTQFGVGAAVVLALVACCSGANALFNDDDDDKPRNTADTSTPTPSSTYTYSPPPLETSSPPPPPPTSAPPPSPTANGLDSVQKGDCLKNTGTDSDPEMEPAKCGPGTYQVLKRIYGTIDSSQCQSVSGATTTYTVTYYVNYVPQISQSYVFCLKRR
jgi:hypothetical protein